MTSTLVCKRTFPRPVHPILKDKSIRQPFTAYHNSSQGKSEQLVEAMNRREACQAQECARSRTSMGLMCLVFDDSYGALSTPCFQPGARVFDSDYYSIKPASRKPSKASIHPSVGPLSSSNPTFRNLLRLSCLSKDSQVPTLSSCEWPAETPAFSARFNPFSPNTARCLAIYCPGIPRPSASAFVLGSEGGTPRSPNHSASLGHMSANVDGFTLSPTLNRVPPPHDEGLTDA